MVVYPNAKINIGLNIVSKRNDGYHNLESIFYPIPWLDILEINKSDEFGFTSSGLTIDVASKDNLVIKAYQLMVDHYHITPCKIHLHKQIPMGAGLGGGSADAAFTLTTLNTLFELNLSQTTLEEHADTLGSDCPFFIENQPKYVSGKGDIMNDTGINLTDYYLKAVNPNIHISTQTAFKGIQPVPQQIKYSEVKASDLLNESTRIKNDFEENVFRLHPLLKDIKIQMKKEGAFYTSMTGTGSTIYGLFKKEPQLSFPELSEKIYQL